ncbi:hypothetical protein HanHA300_Chr12g0431181 [Helianthus annuus]|nr:hypothetical protein HanHA300_Chr12g0431181 [Helianthus annuus]KAJ0491722.1 hypothetical protein HanIR_Chr12g0566931 [Helianthus annuus]KAJ0504116.1 hypothetical protein HanHA89_Chr12g0455771 [Helianthus annuus]
MDIRMVCCTWRSPQRRHFFSTCDMIKKHKHGEFSFCNYIFCAKNYYLIVYSSKANHSKV